MAIDYSMISKRLFDEMAKTLPEFKRINYPYIPKDQKCNRCKDIFFFDGCPHCGNTFLNRDILRQTS